MSHPRKLEPSFMADPSADTIIEKREELMVSPTGGNPTLRTAHFLKPTVSYTQCLPLSPLSTQSNLSDFKKTSIKVHFKGRRNPQRRWEKWVDHLKPLYQFIWKQAGIYEAILASTYHIQRHDDLVIGLVERWTPQTNTFIFPWGEATITLEDMMVLGGFSVLGESVLSPLSSCNELIKMKENLSEAHKDIRKRTNGITTGHYDWMDHFMGSGCQMEHQAFLSLWLSRYVLPSSYVTVSKNVFPVAVHLSRGTPIALAPAVLSTIYRDLSLLKNAIFDSSKLETCLNLWAPFQFVQLWAWERFSNLCRLPKLVEYGQPRSARWHRVKSLKVADVREAIECAGECFLWRPYAIVVNNWEFDKFHRGNGESILIDHSHIDEDLESFARCLRVSELVGSVDCVELYLPHRVAMQFGLDQDVPGDVTWSNCNPEIAWKNYNKPIGSVIIYIPARLFKSDVSLRYSKWWKESKSLTIMPPVSLGKMEDNHVLVPLGRCTSDCIIVGAGDAAEEDKVTAEELRGLKDELEHVVNEIFRGDADGDIGEKIESLEKPVETDIKCRASMASPTISADKINVNKNGNSVSVKNNEVLDLEARVSKLERIVAGLKTAKLGCRIKKHPSRN